MKYYDLCIIGGGASGLAAASSLDDSIKTCVLEKNDIPGRKLMATGGGRCNITNEACRNKEMTLEFFDSMGLALYHDDEGRYYPYSNQASDVVKMLERSVRGKVRTDIVTGYCVCAVDAVKGGFRVTDGRKTFVSEKLLIASGGKASPAFGTAGDGYRIAKSFGHTVNRLYPILTGISCGDFSDIKGVRARGKAELYCDGRLIKSETGEIQFTADGVSGICIFNLTLYITGRPGEPVSEALKRYELILDMAPDFDEETVSRRKDSFGILSEKLSARVPVSRMKSWKLPVLGVKGWKNAQCTGGGVALDELDMGTMESKLVQGLYFAGEIIDMHGPCGGFNLQYAWETGIKAAKAINEVYTG